MADLIEKSQDQQKQTILLTGGAGYIGSHTLVELITFLVNENKFNDFNVLILDNFCNSSKSIFKRVNKIIEQEFPNQQGPYFDYVEGDVTDLVFLDKLFEQKVNENNKISIIIHFAALKAVGESVQKPLLYYENNVVGALNLLKIMDKYDCRKFIFSSSATVYGQHQKATEDLPMIPNNAYGSTKVCIEYMLRDVAISKPEWTIISLRYFNPCGAHKSYLIGDTPTQPNNLFPVIEQVVIGKREQLSVYGNDYDTIDGTGVRDFIHVVDLAKGHIAALKKLLNDSNKGCLLYNLGTGNGYSVLDIVNMYSRVMKKELPYKIVGRRDGDVAYILASTDKANKELNWKAQLTLEDMCTDSFQFITQYKENLD